MSWWHLILPTWSSGSTATSDNQASAQLPASNLLFFQQTFFYRSDDLDTPQIVFDCGTPRPWQGLFLGYHNGYTGTLRITSGNSLGSLFSSPSFDQTVNLRFPGDLSTWSYFHTLYFASSVQTYRYIGLEIDDEDNPDGFFDASVFMAGEVFTPRIGTNIGSRFGVEDPSTEIRTVSGEGIVRPKRGIRVATWNFPMQQMSDAMKWEEINRVYRQVTPVVAYWEPMTGNYSQQLVFYGYPQWRSGGPFTFSNGKGLFDVEFGIKEV